MNKERRTKLILIRIIGILGVLLVIGGYYLLWTTSPDAELEEVMRRAMAGMLMSLFGSLMVIFYIFRETRQKIDRRHQTLDKEKNKAN